MGIFFEYDHLKLFVQIYDIFAFYWKTWNLALFSEIAMISAFCRYTTHMMLVSFSILESKPIF